MRGGCVFQFLRSATRILVVTMIMTTTAVSALVVGGTRTSAASSASSKSPIRIGLVCSCTGPLSAGLSTVPNVLKAWVDSVNAKGGINGHRVDVFVENDQSNPGVSVAAVHTLIQSDHVIALVDATDLDQGWATYVQQQNVPVVGLLSFDNPFLTSPDFYAEGQTLDSLLTSIAQGAKKVGATNLALFYCAEDPTCQQAIGFLKTAAASVGVKVSATLSVSTSAPNYTAQCLAAKQAGAQALYIADVQNVIEKVGSDCAAQGYTPKYDYSGLVFVSEEASTPGLKINSIVPFPDIPYYAKIPAVAQANAAIDKYARGLRRQASYGETQFSAWISGKLIEAAAAAGHLGVHGTTPTSAQLITGLHSLHGTTLGGLTPPLTFKAGKANLVDCWFWGTIRNGKIGTPYGTQPVCSSSSAS